MKRALVVLAACGAPPTAPPPAAVATVPAWSVRPSGGGIPIDPGAAPDELLDAQGCMRCHAQIVEEWSTSRHALAWTNDIFQTEYETRPQPWCVNCHAPLTTQQRDLDGPRAAQGVDCATCHVRSGRMVNSRAFPQSPHGTVVDASFGSPAFCADCHQFTFPRLSVDGQVESMTEYPMQTTVAAFRAGPYAHERDGCMTCHGSATNHAWGGAHDPGMVDAALDLLWCQRDGELIARVTNTNAGHPVPTGDIHRHLYLRMWRSSAPEAMAQAYFGRRFEPVDDGGKKTIWDSSIAPGASKELRVRADALGGDPGEDVNLELVYVFLLDEFPKRAPTEPSTHSIASKRSAITDLSPCDRAPAPR